MKNNIFKQWIMISLLCILSSPVFSDVEHSGISFSNIDIHGQGTTADVKPGETIGIHAHYQLPLPQKPRGIVKVYFSIDDTDIETLIASGLVIGDQYFDLQPLLFSKAYLDITEQDVDFCIVAPREPGTYQVRFGYFHTYLPDETVVAESWDDDDDLAPGDYFFHETICTITVH